MTKSESLDAIQRHAIKQKLTLQQLCALAGVSYITVWRWFQSQTTPRPRTVQALLDVRVKVQGPSPWRRIKIQKAAK